MSGKLLTALWLSTEDVFYLRMCFDSEGPAILAGIGSITKSEIALSIDLVPEQVRKILSEKFGFSVVALYQPFEEIKKENLTYFQTDW